MAHKFYVDLRSGKVSNEAPGGVVNFISWRRLARQFEAAGETKPPEVIVGMQVDDAGITYHVERAE